MLDVTFGKLTSMHFYAWKLGLKTGMYYLRTKAAADAIKFTVEKQQKPAEQPKSQQAESAQDVHSQQQMKAIQCSLDNPEGCDMCSG